MVIQKAEEIGKELERSISEIRAGKSDLETDAGPLVELCCNALIRLQAIVNDAGFDGLEIQVQYFKSFRPDLQSRYLYYSILAGVMERRPNGDQKLLVRFYRRRMEKIRRFFKRNIQFTRYMNSGETVLDEKLFVTGKDLGDYWTGQDFGLAGASWESSSSCSASNLVARLMAYQSCYTLYASELSRLESARRGAGGGNRSDSFSVGVRWTGEAVNLIELAYGVYLQGQIDSAVGVVEFFERLGSFFGVKLGVPKRGFEDIKRRKRLSKTHFIDRMRESILMRIDEEDGLIRK